jgi:hypothetical protein
MIDFIFCWQDENKAGFGDYFLNKETGKFIIHLDHGYVIIGPASPRRLAEKVIWQQYPMPNLKIQSPEFVQALGEGLESCGH